MNKIIAVVVIGMLGMVVSATDLGDTVSEKKKVNNTYVVKETKDTVYVTKSHVIAMVKDWRNTLTDWRSRSIGFGGGPQIGAFAVNTKPVENLAKVDPRLKNKKFNFPSYNYEPMLMTGGIGHAGMGNGVRIGGGGMLGTTNFASAPYNGDSIMVMNVTLGFGGFFIEKCFVKNKFNYSIGGMIGGGQMSVDISESAFDEFNDDYEGDADANFLFLQAQGGIVYSMFPVFHLGLNVSLPLFYSTNGFDARTSDFATVNPGFYLKFIFGNLG